MAQALFLLIKHLPQMIYNLKVLIFIIFTFNVSVDSLFTVVSQIASRKKKQGKEIIAKREM